MRYIIIGGDAAGMSAAMQIVRNDKQAEIVTLERGTVYSYGQCGLPYAISGVIPSTDQLIARSLETFREKYNIDAKINHDVKRVDPVKKVVYGTNTASGEAFEYGYDKLLIATGADPIVPSVPGIHLPGVYTLKTIADAKRIMAGLSEDVQQITIVGGGYIGLEMAEAFIALGKKVRIIDRGKHLAKIFDPDMAELIHDEADKHGIAVHSNEQVEVLNGKGWIESVQTDKAVYPSDLVLIAVGVRPNTSFVIKTGILTALNGAIHVNQHMETNIQNLYAAGDCAVQYHRIKGQDDYIPLGTTANKQGRIAGLNMVGVPKLFQGIVGTSVLKFMDLTLARTGLSEKEALALSISYKTVRIKSSSAAGYYPDNEPLHVKLIYAEKDKQLLGGQIIGKQGADKRIDVLATALYQGMQLNDLEDLDLSYAPPYNSVWDPLQQAARRS